MSKRPLNQEQVAPSSITQFEQTGIDPGDLTHLTVEDLLYGPIESIESDQEQPYIRDRLSPTPIDPFGLVIHGVSYPDGALHYMDEVFLNRIIDIGVDLPPYFLEAVEAEIQASHSFQLSMNSKSILSLREKYEQSPTSISVEQARQIYLERAGYGSTENRLRIIADFNEVDAIEDMKLTAPLNEPAVMKGLQEYHARLKEMSEKTDINVEFIPAHQQPIRMVDVSKTAHPNTLVTKRTIARAYVKDKVIDLRQKDSYSCLPVSIDTGKALPVVRTMPGAGEVNIQHVSVSAYWAVNHEQSSS